MNRPLRAPASRFSSVTMRGDLPILAEVVYATMKRLCALTVVITLLQLLLPLEGWCGSGDSRASRFSVYSHGFRIGEATSVCSLVGSGDRATCRLSNFTRIHARFLVRSYSLENHEEALVGRDGTLRYTRSCRENGHPFTVEGALENNEFRIRVAENRAVRTIVIPRERYDYTTMDCPERFLKREGETVSLRLLDFEALDVVTRHYTWVRSEELRVNGRSYTFRVIEFEDKNKRCRRWIRSDDVGVMIARQEGTGKAGSYSVRLVEYKTLLF
jgi:hypothetical protein